MIIENLPTMVRNALLAAGRTDDWLAQASDREIMMTPWIGRKALRAIREAQGRATPTQTEDRAEKRLWLAAMAMQEMLASGAREDVAKWAFKIADAMLKEEGK